MIELSRLPFLTAVHREGSVVAAARRLGYTPSAVSQQIGRLERELGTPLLEPAGRGVVLTDAALVLVEAGVTVDRAREEAEGRLEALTGGLTGILRLACFPSAVRGLAAPALAAVRASAPDLRVQLRELAPEPGLAAVVSGDVDLALVHDWVEDRIDLPPGLEAVHLLDDPVDLLVPADHRLATQASVALREAVGEVWVTDASDSICTRWILRLLRSGTPEPRLHFRAEEYASQVALVAVGLCLGVLPRVGCPDLPGTVRRVPIEGRVPTRRLFAVHRATTSRRPAVQRLVEELGRLAATG